MKKRDKQQDAIHITYIQCSDYQWLWPNWNGVYLTVQVALPSIQEEGSPSSSRSISCQVRGVVVVHDNK